METEIIYALSLLLQQVSETSFQLMTEPVKMTMEACIEMAKSINMDATHPFIMTCTPFTEAAIVQ